MEKEKESELKIIDKRIPALPETSVQVEGQSNNAVIMMAMQKGYEPDFISKMLDLQERFEKNEARKAFFEAKANFKAEPLLVKKDKHNKFFDSWYTSLGNLLETYNPTLGKHGLSISFPTPEQTDDTMTVECRLSHRMGHSESNSMTAPIDKAAVGKESGKRSRNPIQDIKSTFTYLRAATCEAALGVAGTEGTIDDDGNSAGSEPTKYEEWSIKLDETVEAGLETLEQWWPKYKDQIKDECGDGLAAKVYREFVEKKNALKEGKEDDDRP